MRLPFLGFFLLSLGSAAPLSQSSPSRSEEPATTGYQEDLLFDWSDAHSPLPVPRAEKLVFRVRAGVGKLDAAVGTVTMESTVEPYRESVLLMGAPEDSEPRHSGRMRIHAFGDYQLFRMDATIETLAHPVRWPFLVYNFTQVGSKERRKEVVLGWLEDKPSVRYRGDTTRDAPKGTRIWKKPTERELPVPALDMVSASYYSRVMVREERLFMRFPVAEKLDLWEITLRRGRTGKIETGAGTFDALQLLLDPKPYPGEVSDDKVQEKAESFEGLFGLHGSIALWVERETGVPVLISGELPVGPIDLSISIVLQSYSGTPPAFRPLP